MKKALFLYNHRSGNRSIPKKLDYLVGKFQENGVLLQPYRIMDREYKEVGELIKNEKYEMLIASGGDGTINTVVNFMMKKNIKLPLGIIPSGTSNDLGKSLGISKNIDFCIENILANNIVNIDVGLINEEHYFLSSYAGGIFAGVSFNTNSKLKKSMGIFAYYLTALNEMKNIKPFKIKIETEDDTIEEDVLVFLIVNGNTAAGFTNIVHQADVTDGCMDILLVRSCSRVDIASLFLKAKREDISNERNVRIIRTNRCIIEAEGNLNISIDGEQGEQLPSEVRFVKKALPVFWKKP